MGRELASLTKDGTTYNYKYNYDGLRTYKSDGTNTYNYIWQDGKLISQTGANNTIKFIYEGDKPTAINYNGEEYYYVTNLQGDVIAILDSNGNCVVEYTYDAWGKVLSLTGSLASTLGRNNPLRYRGYCYDNETGFYYLQSRYYDPTVGGFINADEIGYLGVNGTIPSYNLFAYCENNPVNNSDQIGNFVSKIIAGVIGALIGATTYITSYLIEKYCLKIKSAKFSVWGLLGSIAFGVLDGVLSFSKIPKLLSFVITFTSDFLPSRAAGDHILESVFCAFIVAIINMASSGGMSISKISKYNKQLINKLRKGNWKIIKQGIKTFFKKIKRYVKKYLSDSVFVAIFGVGMHSVSKATLKSVRK